MTPQSKDYDLDGVLLTLSRLANPNGLVTSDLEWAKKQLTQRIDRLCNEARVEVLKVLANGARGQRQSKFTKKQMDVMAFIVAYHDKYHFQPKIQEVADEFGISLSTAHQHVETVRQKAARLQDTLTGEV